jgi:hypothetical protein
MEGAKLYQSSGSRATARASPERIRQSVLGGVDDVAGTASDAVAARAIGTGRAFIL